MKIAAAPPPPFDAAFRDALHALFVWRRDVRRFRAAPLPPGLLEALVGQACLGPSVGLSQPARFVLVEEPGRRAAVLDIFRRANAEALAGYDGERQALYARLKLEGLESAPVHLAVFADEATDVGAGLGRRTMPEMLRYSAVAAVVQLWLAARAHGVGLGWVSILHPAEVASALDLPEPWALVGYLCIGYPAEEACEPELAREGWETRRGVDRLLVHR